MPDRPALAVVDASVVVDLLAGTDRAAAVSERLRGTLLHAPAHLDAEVLSALGRLHRAEAVTTAHVRAALDHLVAMPVRRHPLPELLAGAWRQRASLRVLDALYVELAARLQAPLLTTDLRLARASSHAEPIG